MPNLVFGKKNIFSIIKNFPSLVEKIYVVKGFLFDNEIFEVVKTKNLKLEFIENQKFQKILNQKVNHQNIIAYVKDFEYSQLQDLISNKENQTILVLDRVQDPNNFGAIIRSAVLFGVDGIVILDRNQVDVTAAVLKTSAGTAYEIAIAKVANLANALNVLKQKGFWVYASYLSNDATNIADLKFENKKVILIGSEGKGLSNKLVSHSDFKFKINTTNIIDSLNVSVATGIILFKASLD
ncbi:23S rRNA (guanosine(2251)-2'-O)-methyltransferase RlmB [Spiroplasma tabanidicola]|uniref:23S rRNA (Guanosine2251-2'-O)-methyltransferase n=1 Tax=Spiroplasma tabanidicola TaxID=324079 RepID=A0A6I6C7J5_9MOLU|nr:23S rRNA (guanosine(2251)-2'-O)-methyltransferase RlmB [Spiroplasma tabanidicola]QGS51399.1 23S rRNA (guanosine2251-2'-O)-methyltransferase [Spiroplasma tabanidicola]